MGARNKTWKFLDASGEEICVLDLVKFCKDNSLNYTSMMAVGTDPDKQATHCGYIASPNHEYVTSPRNTTSHTLYNTVLGGITQHLTSRAKLAKQSGISAQSVWRLMSGQAVSVRGWEITTDNDYAKDIMADIPAAPVQLELDLDGEDQI